MMKTAIFACLLALATADQFNAYPSNSGRQLGGIANFIEILRDDRNHPEGGRYTFDVETADGIVRSESGSPLAHAGGAVGQQGSFSYPLPNGETFTLKFVANENGYQPESPFLPVAPEFPHPIPQFVLDQIEFARLEDLEAQRSGRPSAYP